MMAKPSPLLLRFFVQIDFSYNFTGSPRAALA